MNPLPGAYIDLKNVDFYLEDGFAATGAVNNVAGYAAAATTILIDTIVIGANGGVVGPGVTLTFAGHDTEYSIVSGTGGPPITSMVISPGLTDAVIDGEAITFGPHRLYVKIGEGNLTYSEKVTREFKKDRGRLDQVRNGDEMEMDVNFQFAWIYLSSPTGSTTPSVEEFLYNTGPAAGYISTGAACEPFSVDIVMRNNGDPSTCAAIDEQVEEIRLPKFYYESLDHDAKAGTVAAVGKCNATKAVVTRRDL